MDPDEKEENGPSLALTFSERIEESHIEEISKFNVGDEIRFNGTLVGMGDQYHVHHIHAFDVSKGTGHNSEVKPHVHDTGRYSIKRPDNFE